MNYVNSYLMGNSHCNKIWKSLIPWLILNNPVTFVTWQSRWTPLLKGQGLACGDACSNSSIVCHLSSTLSPCALSGRPPLKDCVALAWIASTPRSWLKQCEHIAILSRLSIWIWNYSINTMTMTPQHEKNIQVHGSWPWVSCLMVHWSMAHHCFIMLPLLNLALWSFFMATAATVPLANNGCCVKVQVQVRKNCIVSESVWEWES